jgi:hypothetical protein
VHNPSSTKYLLLSALALAVIVGDAYFGRDNSSRSGQPADTASEAAPALPPPAPQPPTNPQVASLSPSTVELTEAESAVSVEKTQPAETPSTTDESLAETLKSIEADYHAMTQTILEKSAPVIAPTDRTQLAFLDQEKLADVGKVLTTDELEVYQNQTDPAAAPRRR